MLPHGCYATQLLDHRIRSEFHSNPPPVCFYSLNRNDTRPAYRSATVSIVSAHSFSTGTSYLIRQLTSALVATQGFEPRFSTLEVGSYQLRRNRHSVTINASPLAENYLNLINILYHIYLNKSILNCDNQKHKDNECNRYFPR